MNSKTGNKRLELNVKNLILTVFSIILLISTALLVFCSANKTVNASESELFSFNDKVMLNKNVSAYDGFMNDRTGYMFSATENGATFNVAEKMSGEFSVEFIPVSSKRGEIEFGKYTFGFSSDNSNLSFSVGFSPLSEGVLMTLSVSNNSIVSKSVVTTGSFSNLSEETIKFGFDPETMVITDAFGTELANLKSEETMNIFSSNNVFESFTEYSVSMKFSEITAGRVAKVVIFNIGGQDLSGNVIANTSAPIIVGEVNLDYGVKSKVYAIKKDIKTYDVIDGFNDVFAGKIEVLDEEKNLVCENTDTFTPEQAGKYYVCYTPVDSNGMYGKTYQYPIYVFENQPSIEIETEYPLSDLSVGAGETVLFPNATASSYISASPLPVSVKLQKGSEEVFSLSDNADGFEYTFEKVGTYTLNYEAKDSTGNTKTKTITVTVTDNKILENFDIEREYRKNSNLDLSGVAVQGENVSADTVVKFPDGRETTSKTVKLDADGLYSVTATATYGGVQIKSVKYFNVKTDNAYLWKSQSGLTVESNASAPSYADYNYNGTMLTVSRPMEIEYENIINIKDNTADDLLFELFVAPVTAGVEEAKCIEIILTDVYDESNVLVIRMEDGPWGYYPEKTSVLSLRTENYSFVTPAAGDSRNTVNNVYYNRMVLSSMYGKVSNDTGTYPSQSVKFYFDYDTGLLYANYATTLSSSTAKALVGDFTEEAFAGIGQGNAFKGFTTGEAKVSVKISSLQQTAHVLILNVDGQNMSGQYNSDTTAPSIFLDYKGNTEDKLPLAQVGKKYKVFDASAVDTTDGRINKIDFAVYKMLSGIWQHYEKQVDGFIPDEVGEYKIVYTVTDVAGNVGTKEIVVEASNDIPAKQYVFSPLNLSTITVGKEVRIYDGVASGSNGALTTNLKVLYGTEEIELDENGCFVPVRSGTYTISVVVKDYIEESDPFTFEMTASYDANPIISERSMPKSIRKGEEFVFPSFSAKLYSDSGITDVPVSITVNGVPVTDNKFTATEEGTVTVVVKAGDAHLNYDITVVSSENKSVFLEGYFATDSTVNVEKTGIAFTSSTDAAVYFTEKIDTDFLNIGLAIVKDSNMGEVAVTLTDISNPDLKVTVRILKVDETTSKISVNGIEYEIKGTFVEGANTLFDKVLEYKVSERAFYVSDTKVATILKTDDGKAFYGFESGAVYVEFAMKNVEGESVFSIKKIANQQFSSDISADRVGPTIQIFGSISGVNYGESFKVPTAKAFDIFSGVRSLTVTVTAPGGTKIVSQQPADTEYVITADKYGTYNILFEAYDKSGNKSSRRLSVSISNRTVPKITINGEVPLTAKVGQEITLPSVVEVEGTTCYILYCAPDGEYMLVKNNKFTPTQKGIYIIQYFAQFESGASSTQVFRITVK